MNPLLVILFTPTAIALGLALLIQFVSEMRGGDSNL